MAAEALVLGIGGLVSRFPQSVSLNVSCEGVEK